MKKITLIILTSLFMINCSVNKLNKKEISQDVICDELLFKTKVLNDTLIAFINSVDSIPNPYGAPKFNLVQFLKENNDTLFYLTVGIGLYEIIDKSRYRLVGGTKIRGEYVAVYYSYFDDLSKIVNEDILSIEYIERADEIGDMEEIWEWDYFNPSEWIYKLKGDSLEVIKKFNRSK